MTAPELPLFSRVKSPVRRSDPETSREAARVASARTTATQRAVLAVLRAHGPLTDEQIWHDVNAVWAPFSSPSGCRTRRKELVNLGLVRAVPGKFGRTAAGNKCQIWQICE